MAAGTALAPRPPPRRPGQLATHPLGGWHAGAGSNEIIDWAERQSPDGDRSLAPTGDLEGGRSMEQRADRVVGVHVRRLFYSEVLPHQAHLAKPWLLLNTSPIHRLVGNLMWPAVRKRMIQAMDTPPEAAPESRAKLEAELDWLDETLSDSRRFLAGERFSRVDLTVAALLAPFARPEQAGIYNAMTLPPALEEDVSRWRHRPSMTWVRTIYEEYRRPDSALDRVSRQDGLPHQAKAARRD